MHDFIEFKPRKAKFGFRGRVYTETIVDNCLLLDHVLGKPDNVKWWYELNTNMTSKDFLVYINDQYSYDLFKLAVAGPNNKQGLTS